MIQKKLLSTPTTLAEMASVLRRSGYIVVDPSEAVNVPKDISQIMETFYGLTRKRLGEAKFAVIAWDRKADVECIRRYILKSLRSGYTRQDAVKYLEGALRVLFSNIDEIKLTLEYLTLPFLLSSKGSWILIRAAQAQENALKTYENSCAMESYLEGLYNDCSDEQFQNLQQERHNKLLGEVSNGEKERKD